MEPGFDQNLSSRPPARDVRGMTWWRNLFNRTTAMFLILVVLFQLFIFGVAYFLVVRPLLQTAANDLAALMVLSAERWVELPPEALPFYQEELQRSYQLRAVPAAAPLSGRVSLPPYIAYLEASLSQRLGHAVTIHPSAAGDEFWVDIPIDTRTVRFGFSRARIGANSPSVMLLLVGVSVLLSLVAAVVVRRWGSFAQRRHD